MNLNVAKLFGLMIHDVSNVPICCLVLVTEPVVGAWKGLNAGGGPSGVGRAVNESVIIAFMLLFFLNSIITAIYFQIVPPPGF